MAFLSFPVFLGAISTTDYTDGVHEVCSIAPVSSSGLSMSISCSSNKPHSPGKVSYS